VFFFWILIYIEKEGKMKISCNRVSKVFVYQLVWGFLVEVFAEFLLGIFAGFLPGIFGGFLLTIWLGIFVGFLAVGSFWGFWYIHGYLIRYILFDNKRFIKDKRKGTMQYKVLYYIF
jgi:hypothetical protein